MNVVKVGYGSTNYYVLAGDPEAMLLIDCGWPGTMGRLKRRLQEKGIELGHIRYLLVTHYHPDHAGAVEELKRLGLRLIVPENQVAGITFLNGWMKARPQYPYVDITLENNVNVRSAESRAFLGQLGLEGEIILTPGHSDDSVTLILDCGAAFTGDLPPPGIFGDPQHPAEASWALIRAHHVHTVYPGHGPPGQIYPQIDKNRGLSTD